MKNTSIVSLFIIYTIVCCCTRSADSRGDNRAYTERLRDSITAITASYPGEIGVAVIVGDTDTITVNDRSIYPMMSVFKLHQAIAVCNFLDRTGGSLDSLINVSRDSLDPDTWSPMLKDRREPTFQVSIGDLLRYSLIQSDNNASNLLFREIVGVADTDSIIATLIPRHTFNIEYSEAEMSTDHAKAYSNYTSPLGAAMLIKRLFTDSVVSSTRQDFIRQALGECNTGRDRIIAPLLDKEGVQVFHKTGSGYSANGILAAHNDVAYIRLPGEIGYSLAVFVKDLKGNEAEASTAIAKISATVYNTLSAIE